MQLEQDLEEWARERVAREGWELVKVSFPGRKGAMDDLLLKPNTVRVDWFEFKQPNQNPTELQEAVHEKFRAHGQRVFVIRKPEDLERYIRAHKGNL